MIRMEIALFMVLAFVAFIYFSAGRKPTRLHKVFSILLIVMLFHLTFDGITVYTVNHLDTVPPLLNEICHRLFIGSMILVFYLFYRYMTILVEDETGKRYRLTMPARFYLLIAETANLILPVHYAITPQGNYSDGIHVTCCYISVGVYLILGVGVLIANWRKVAPKKKMAICIALAIELICSVTQGIHHTWLISGLGLTLITMAFYLILENPDILRAELVEQKMSMLYLKSQVNPHFLYNTLDTIRIQAQLDGNRKVADLLMRLVDFFRLSIKVDRQMVELDDELELLEAYLDLMCYRYPEIQVEYDVDPDLGTISVPNFILQPIVENSLLHGLKNKGYKGTVIIRAHTVSPTSVEITVSDNGSGFHPERKAEIDQMLLTAVNQEFRLKGNSIGLLNIQKRIKYLCGREYGLSYTDNPDGGVTAHLLLPLIMEEEK